MSVCEVECGSRCGGWSGWWSACGVEKRRVSGVCVECKSGVKGGEWRLSEEDNSERRKEVKKKKIFEP